MTANRTTTTAFDHVDNTGGAKNTLTNKRIKNISDYLPVAQFGMKLLEVSVHLAAYLPIKYIPFMNNYVITPMFHYFGTSDEVQYFTKGYQGLLIEQHPKKYNEMEYFLPNSNFSLAFQGLQQLYENNKNDLKGPNFIVQLRWTQGQDNIWLSPFNTNQDVNNEKYYVGIATLSKTHPCEDYFTSVENLFLQHGGKPHWGKYRDIFSNNL